MNAVAPGSTAARVAAVGATAPGWVDAWESALAELEIDVAAAERVLALDHLAPAAPAVHAPGGPWTPPTGLGPLPAVLEDRARALLGRQVETARRLAEAAELSRRHSKAAQALRGAPPSLPVYLDTPC